MPHKNRGVVTQAFAEYAPAAVRNAMPLEDVVCLSNQTDIRVRRQQIRQDRRAAAGEPVDEDGIMV
jgi:hypothetical protein